MDFMTLKELRRTAHEKLRQSQSIDSPETDADLIIMHVLDLDKTALLTKDMSIPDALAIEVNSYINRRLSGMPVQYITGSCEFMSLKFMVNKNVLIPRADTETLVEAVIEKYRTSSAAQRILDIGCGSGCIGISLVKHLPNCTVTELDISEQALNLAKRNAEMHQVQKQIEFVCGDIKNGLPDLGFIPDCIISNPPYIRTDDLLELQPEVIEHEPILALDGGDDGLDFYRAILSQARPVKGGITAFEVGYDQADDVANLMHKHGYRNIEILKDLSGIERVVLGFAA